MKKRLELRDQRWNAFWAAILCGVAVHGFALFNVLHNYDDILQNPVGYGAGITSGRWLLTLLGDFCQKVLYLNFNLPTVNGLAYILFIALTAAVVVDVLKIRKTCNAVLTGCLLVTFPTVCGTMAFRFTAPFYGLSLLLAALAVWVLRKDRFGLILSALCMACSMGIYQAYVPFAISLFVLVLMRESLEEDARLKEMILRGVYDCAAIIFGVVLYFALLKACQVLYPTDKSLALDSYQGIDTMGKLSLSQIPYLLKKSWLSAVFFALTDYCNLVSTAPLKLLWCGLIAMILVLALLVLMFRRPKPLLAAFFCLMGLLVPLSVNFIVVMAPEGIIYTIMVYPFVLIAVAPLMLLELLPDGKKFALMGKVIAILTAAIVFYNGYNTNFNYTGLYYANRQVENYVSGMMTQMRMTEGYTPEKKWVFLGANQDPSLWDIWNVAPYYYGGVYGSSAKGLMQATYSFDFWFYAYMGYGIPQPTAEEEALISRDPRVEEMPCWPENGSMKVIDDYLVVKFEDMVK